MSFDCPRTARVDAGGDCPVGSEDPSHRQEQLLAPISTTIEPGLITGDCCLPVLYLRQCSEAGVTSPGASLGGLYGDQGLPKYQDLPLWAGSNEMASQYGRYQRSHRSCRNGVVVLQDPPYGTPNRLLCLEGVLLEGFPLAGCGFHLPGLVEGRDVKPIAGRKTPLPSNSEINTRMLDIG
ncbi:hypothetical protein ElyMa_003466500 [Elysia marginata]|uniref:Uncharacterized protein n=1 Tax=Elysia marginata TaxID=1093978 RepID=A0AAV4EB33_9GAST|nr:hypothetical protein ElyMa_003466500 [Elysia marginata]